MQIQHTDFTLSPSLRVSLKRGRAREALTHAQQNEANIPALLSIAKDLRPNHKARSRMAQRLMSVAGVVHARPEGSDSISIIARNTRYLTTRKDADDIFGEMALLYTVFTLTAARNAVGVGFTHASFSLHALERIVERSTLPLDRALLPLLDKEAYGLFQSSERGKTFSDDDDTFIPARIDGLWAGSWDTCAADNDWGLRALDPERPVPIFSARTFLGPDQMRPSVWLRWKRDPNVTIN